MSSSKMQPVEFVDPDAMKNELKNFLKGQLKSSSEDNSTDISLLQTNF
jgi:hypothetical protein